MTSSAPVPRPGIMEITPYAGGEGRVAGALRLALNENALGCSPLAREAYLKAAAELHRYPDGSAQALRDALGLRHGLDPARIVCGNGSEELITLLLRGYAGPGDEVVYSRHGFLMYPLGAMAVGATPVAAAEKDLRADVDALLAAVTERTKIVFVANPNNPTGSWLTRAELGRLHAGLPPHVLLVVDAAYAEFTGGADCPDGRELAAAQENAVMLRTFSKAYGLAALRLGWGYFPAAVAGVLNRLRGAFNINAPAQAVALAALEDGDFVARTAAMAAAGRVFLSERLGTLGVTAHPGLGNFLLAGFGREAEGIRLALRDRGVFVRQTGAYGLPRHLRLTIGTAEDNARLAEAVAAAI